MSSGKQNSDEADMEYQYADEGLGKEGPQQPSRKKFMLLLLKDKFMQKLPKSRKFRVLFFLITILYLIYSIFHMGDSKKIPYKPKAEAGSAVEPMHADISSMPHKVVHPVSRQEKTTSIPHKTHQQSIQVKPAVSGHNRHSTTPHHAISRPVTQKPSSSATALNFFQVRQIQSQLQTLNNNIMQLQAALLNLTGSAVALSDKVNRVERVLQSQKTSNGTVRLPVFYLQSLVASRAWLYDKNGKLITVKVGDSIAGYGKVQQIDTKSGVIFTDSGRRISYGTNDS